MADVIFDKVEKVYDNDVHAVHDLSLEIRDGEFVVLVGPSGCGKTTALRMVAGLEDITDGRISIGERVVNDLTPKERDIAMVFQNYALYPHLSVADNIGFGLRLRHTPKEVVEERVAWAANFLGLTPYLQRRPKELSPGPPPAPGGGPKGPPGGAARGGGGGARFRAKAAGVPDGRAPLEPRREA